MAALGVPIADRERRVVAAHRAGPDEDCIALGTESMGVGAGFGSGDPLRGAVGRCRPAIEAGGKLGDHEWTTRSSMVEVRGKLLGDEIGTDADGDLNPRRLERADALAGDVTVGITDPDDDPSNAGLDEGVTARTGATGVITRLECGVERRTAYRVGAGGIGATRSAWRPPGGSVAPSKTCPSRATTTAPTQGLGEVEWRIRAALATARSMNARSSIIRYRNRGLGPHPRDVDRSCRRAASRRGAGRR